MKTEQANRKRCHRAANRVASSSPPGRWAERGSWPLASWLATQ